MNPDTTIDPNVGSFSDEELCDVAVGTLDDAPFAFLVISTPDYRYLFLNKAALAAVKVVGGVDEASAAIGKHPWDFFEHWRDIFLPAYERARETGEMQVLRECKYPRPERNVYWDAIIIPNSNEAGEVTSFSTIGFEATERVEAQQELARLVHWNQEHQEFLQELIEASPVGIAVVSRPDYRYELANPTYKAIPGTPDVDMVGRTIYEVFPDAAEQVRANLDEAFETGRTASLREVEASVGPGRERTYWDVDTIPLKDSEGSVASALVLAREATEHVVAEEALRESEERLRQERTILNAIAENTDAHLAYLDPDLNFVWVNHTYAVACKRAPEDLIGRNHFDLFPHEENEAIFRRVMDTGEPAIFKAKPFAHPDQPGRGTTYWDWTLSPIKDSSGKVQGLVLSLTDVTELKQSEEALQNQVCLLQRALLPTEPVIGPGYRLASAYIPAYAEQGEEIGGDFYDVFPTEAGRTVILIGDVSGKGIEAASLAVTTRSTVRAYAYDMSSPEYAFRHANSLLSREQIAFGHFVTTFLVVLDTRNGDLLYSSAGHPPAIIQRADGSIELLDIRQLPIAVMGEAEFAERTQKLNPGDRLILYTDGITEARHDAALFGLEGLMRVLARNRNANPRELIGDIVSAATEWAQGRLRDDTALIVIEREI